MARRPLPAAMDIEQFGDWRFDRPNLNVQFPAPDGKMQQINLTDREFRLAMALFRHTGQPVSRAYLLESLGVHGEEMPSRALDSHVYRLRNKHGLHSASGMRLQTVYGRGYRLERVSSDSTVLLGDREGQDHDHDRST
jgi:DNA-binding response OmpR family regulator